MFRGSKKGMFVKRKLVHFDLKTLCGSAKSQCHAMGDFVRFRFLPSNNQEQLDNLFCETQLCPITIMDVS